MKTNMLLLCLANETKNLKCSPFHWPVQSGINAPIGAMQATDDCYAAKKKDGVGFGGSKIGRNNSAR